MTLAQQFIRAWQNPRFRPRGTMSAAAVAAHVDPHVTHHDGVTARHYLFSDSSTAATYGRGSSFRIYHNGEQIR